MLNTLLCAQRREYVSCLSPELEQVLNAWPFSGGWEQERLGKVFVGTAGVILVVVI